MGLLDKYLKGPPAAEPEDHGSFDYNGESMKIVKRVVGCSDEEAQDLVMALCQLIEDKAGAGSGGVVIKIKS